MGQSIHYALLEEVQRRVIALNLDGLEESSVLVRWTPLMKDVGGRSEKNFPYPAIVVCPVGQEQIIPVTNREDDWGIPVLLAIAAQQSAVKATEAAQEDLDRNLYWRERLLKAFRPQTIWTSKPTVEFHNCRVEPGPIVDWPKLALDQIYTGYLVVRFFTRVDE